MEPLKNVILRELHSKGNKNVAAAERVLELFSTVDQLRSKAAMATVILASQQQQVQQSQQAALHLASAMESDFGAPGMHGAEAGTSGNAAA